MSTTHVPHPPVPKTLESWVRLLDGVDLPVPAANHDRVRAALNDSRRSLREIAEMMQESPALVLSVMREANHHTHGITEQAESLEIAINRLVWHARRCCWGACQPSRRKKFPPLSVS